MVPSLSQQFEELGRELPSVIEQFSPESMTIPQNISFGDVSQKFVTLINNPFSTTVGFITAIISMVAVISMSFYMSLQEDGLKKSFLSHLFDDIFIIKHAPLYNVYNISFSIEPLAKCQMISAISDLCLKLLY